MTNPIQTQIDSARKRVLDIQTEMRELDIALRVAVATLDAFEIAAQAFESVAPKTKAQHAVKTRKRVANTEWQSVFQLLHDHKPDAFGYDDIYAYASSAGIGVRKASLRTKMMNYNRDGYVNALGGAQFKISDLGIEYFKIQAISSLNENGAAQAAPEAGTEGATTPYVPYSNPQPSWTS